MLIYESCKFEIESCFWRRAVYTPPDFIPPCHYCLLTGFYNAVSESIGIENTPKFCNAICSISQTSVLQQTRGSVKPLLVVCVGPGTNPKHGSHWTESLIATWRKNKKEKEIEPKRWLVVPRVINLQLVDDCMATIVVTYKIVEKHITY